MFHLPIWLRVKTMGAYAAIRTSDCAGVDARYHTRNDPHGQRPAHTYDLTAWDVHGTLTCAVMDSVPSGRPQR